MKRLQLSLLLITFYSVVFSQNSGSIMGHITDKQTSEPLARATVTIRGSLTTVATNDEGRFVFSKLKAGKITLTVSYVGYDDVELLVDVVVDTVTIANIALTSNSIIGNEVVVSAFKRPEKITNAAASIQVIGVKDLEQFAGSNVGELLSKVQGVEYTRNGVSDITFNARGFHSAFNNKFLQLVDGRNSMAALSGGLPVLNRSAVIKEDIERLEIVLGPQSALYGPNALNAVFNTMTKDPRKYQGLTVSLSAGNRYQFSGRMRYATKINSKWAYKLTGEYAVGKEYVFYDSVYLSSSAPSLSIPEHNVDFNFRNIRGEGHIYYSLTAKTDIIVSGGGSNNTWPQVTTAGRNQMRGVTYSFVQARLVNPHFFVNLYNTWGNIGNSYPIANYTRRYWVKTHPPNPLPPDSAELVAVASSRFKEQSQRLNAEAQYNYTFQEAGLFLVAGLNYQKEKPNGYGVNLVDSFEHIYITQYGAVLQVEKTLPLNFRFIGAARYDHHSNFRSFISPKLGLVKGTGIGNFRITWGRAYGMPSILNQYASIGGSLFGNGEGITYLSMPDSIIRTTQPLKPEQVSTWELGYKGTFAKKLYVDINYYNGRSENFISPARQVRGKAMFVGSIPVTPSNTSSFSTFFNYVAVRSYGLDAGLAYSFNKFINLALRYSWFGSDITADDLNNDANNDGYVSLEETSLNAPKNRAVAILGFQNLCKQRMFVNLSARYVQQYDFYSGSQIGTEAGKGTRGKVYGGTGLDGKPRYYLKNFDWGPLGGFTTIDLSAGYQLNEMINVNVGITNLFNTKQIEFVGSPSIGRLIMFEIKVHVPNGAKTTKSQKE